MSSDEKLSQIRSLLQNPGQSSLQKLISLCNEPLLFDYALEHLESWPWTIVQAKDLETAQHPFYRALTLRGNWLDLSPLQNSTHLTHLSLTNEQHYVQESYPVPLSLEPLFKNERLKELSLLLFDPEEPDFLEHFPLLEKLTLRCSLPDATASLGHCTKLNYLLLLSTDYDRFDASFFSQLQELETLSLHDCRFLESHLPPGTAFPKLKSLQVSNCNLASIDFLRHSPNLESLILNNTEITSMEVLQHCQKLNNLSMDGAQLNDLSVLQTLSSLRSLGLNNMTVSELESLNRCERLSYFHTANTPLTTLSFLEGCLTLEDVEISNAPLKEIPNVSTMPQLKSLMLDECNIQTLEPLQGHPSLEVLMFDGSPIKDLSPLSSLQSLTALLASNTPVADLSVLVDCPNITEVSIQNTAVTDLTPLLELKDLEYLYVDQEKFSEEALETIRSQFPGCDWGDED